MLSIAKGCGDIFAVSNTLTLAHTLTSHVTLVKITAISELSGCDKHRKLCLDLNKWSTPFYEYQLNSSRVTVVEKFNCTNHEQDLLDY